MNNAPFKIGQKMVRIGPSNIFVTKGSIYTCEDCFCCDCGKWHVTISEYPRHPMPFSCCSCASKIKTSSFRGGDADNFAPVDDQKERIRYVAVSETLREKAVEMAAIETN